MRDKRKNVEYNRIWVSKNRAYRNEYNKNYKRNKRSKLLPIVYAYFSYDGTCLYVGRGSIERPKKHRTSTWWTSDNIFLSMTCDNEWHAMEMEGKWGNHYRPLYNKDGYRHASISN